MTIAKSPYPFYTVLMIDESSFDDIKERLDRTGVLWKYLILDNDAEAIVFGTTALKKEPTKF